MRTWGEMDLQPGDRIVEQGLVDGKALYWDVIAVGTKKIFLLYCSPAHKDSGRMYGQVGVVSMDTTWSSGFQLERFAP